MLTEDLLRKFDTPGPRYTSYPTADRFAETFGPADAARVLEARRRGSSSQVTPPGWFLVRAIAMVFDRHLREARISVGSLG